MDITASQHWLVLFLVTQFIAVCIYRLMMISIERSETAQKSALEIRHKFSPRQNAVWDKIKSENFFPMVGIFFWTEFCLGLYLSQTEFCLRLDCVLDWICLGLNFVSDYIPQLYFVCNLLIYIETGGCVSKRTWHFIHHQVNANNCGVHIFLF